MNYFCHGRRFLANPYFVAGTAIPDWLRVVNRKARVRSRHAESMLLDPRTEAVAVAGGIIQHHRDDGWFHATRAFAELTLHFTAQLRQLLEPDESLRPSFLGHILVELLLDWAIARQQPGTLDAYYAVLGQIDPQFTTQCVQQMTPHPVDHLAIFISRFCQERFLYDYAEDAKLLGRLNAVMRRVGLPPLPTKVCGFFPEARELVCRRQDELLQEPGETL